ncbi:MaoC/PaaZ C-terminal domain-containing protein [Roseococcus thiosulfatophilus]|uniref:MaoC/PaaZ C-terminal domain-containing protein n=1 Tax=Roseococcus thiosulfatophilus TaxID=35813 RepID=UPI001A8CFD62|nr:MaoC/PaaZ C-terminal domain-containing protein [Roseococcus thiosulfatophilus]
MNTPLNSFDELSPGQRFDYGSFRLSEAEIIAYARDFDPQPFHMDPEAARAAPLFGGLVASGLHTMGMCFGMIMRSGIWTRISLGGSGIDTKWPAPLRPDEEVAVASVVESVKPSRSRPEMGVAMVRHLGTRVADGVVVIDMLATHFLKR